MLLGRLMAVVLLGLAWLKTLLSLPFRRKRAVHNFLRAYGPESLFPTSPEVHRLLVQPSPCTGCGRCDRVARAPGPGVSHLVLGASRSLPDADLAHHGFSRFSEQDLARAEALCPVGVPIRRIARRAALQAQAMEEASDARDLTEFEVVQKQEPRRHG